MGEKKIQLRSLRTKQFSVEFHSQSDFLMGLGVGVKVEVTRVLCLVWLIGGLCPQSEVTGNCIHNNIKNEYRVNEIISQKFL